MVRVKIHRNKYKKIEQFKIKGHANAGKHGKDIVCAAVSMLAQTTLLGLSDVANIEIQYKLKDGYIQCSIPKEITQEKRREADILLETMVMGLKNVSKEYSKYMYIDDKE